MRTLRTTIYVLALLATPVVALAAAPRTFLELSDLIVIILDNATMVLIVAGVVIYFYGISTNILNFSEDGYAKVRAYFLWGIIILFVMVSIWGILKILQDTLFGPSSNSPTTGQRQDVPDAFKSPQFTGE